jgi:hypothetical protein
MNALRKNRLSSPSSNNTTLESKVLLAASNFKITFGKKVSQKVKNAAQQAQNFWSKYINTNKKVAVRIDEKKFNDETLGIFFKSRSLIQIDTTHRNHKNNPAALATTMMHEVGHALGLGHGDNGSIMARTAIGIRRGVNPQILQQLKKQGYRSSGAKKKTSTKKK